MAIKPIIQMGNQHLYQAAKPVKEFNTPELHALIQDLWDTMAFTQGVGIAAPQIDIPLQVTVFGFEHSERYPHAAPVPKTLLINPSFEPLSEEMDEDWEGCLSAKNNHAAIRGLVPRYKKIRYSGYDEKGQFFQREVENFHARLVQHEYDHLQGKLFYFRVKDFRYFGFEEEVVQLIKQSRQIE